MGFALEDQLLIQCSRVRMDDEAIITASNLLQQDLDWDYIVEVSIRHAVSPLFYHGLNQVAQVAELDSLVPARIMGKLQNLYNGNRSRNRRLYRVIGEISKAFERVGVQAMGLKDIQLTRQVYPDIALRPMGDIDILIHREDYEKVADCMAALGFVPLPDPDIPFTLKYAWAHHFHRPTDDVWVDMQWNILQKEWDIFQEGNFDFEIDRMWRGADLMTIDDYQILVPKPEDMLFHLCLHLEGHFYAELVLFCDIVELLRYHDYQLDWPYFVGLVKKYKVESSVYYVLFLAQRLFKTSFPPFLLQQLEPSYFKAGMFKPLFGNLTTLHLSLDEIRQAAFPPNQVMDEFETVVRQQAASAMQLYREIDKTASAFIDSGGDVIILEGTPSKRIFPDPLLRPFEEVRFFILNHDLPRMRQVLSNHGFKCKEVHGAETYRKEWEIISKDPMLVDRSSQMILRVDIESELNDLFRLDEDSMSKKDAALGLIKARLIDHHPDHPNVPVQIKVMALSPEDTLLYFSARLGKQRQNRLFGLNSLLEFFRGYSGSLDWQQVANKAQQYGVSEWVGEGLFMASELLNHEQIPPAALTLCAGSTLRPRVLERARYGLASLGFYTDFKSLFFYLLSFLSTDGVKAKFRYVLRSLFGQQGNKPVLPGLMLEIATGIVSLSQRKQRTITDLAYWVESGAALETGPGDNRRV